MEIESRLNPNIDYTKSDKPFVVCRFITECGNKLNAKVMTTATALAFFHRYNKASPDPSYDPYVRKFQPELFRYEIIYCSLLTAHGMCEFTHFWKS